MATITLSVPEDITDTLVSAVRERYGEDVKGMTDTQALKYAIRRGLLPIVRSYMVRHAAVQAVSDAHTALAAVQRAARTAAQARKDAEAAAIAEARAQVEAVT